MLPLHRRLLVVTLLCAMAVPAALATPLGAETHIVTSAGVYAPRNVVVDTDGTLWYTNADLRAHDVVAVATGPSDNPWCGRYAAGACPLFASRLLGLGEQGVVEGTHQLTPTDSYAFFCTVHPWMTGTLTAL